MTTSERLAEALKAAGAPKKMIANARRGYYDDFKSPLATPIAQLVSDARSVGLVDIAKRAIAGDFDSTKEESDEWARSEDGRATFASFTPKGTDA